MVKKWVSGNILRAGVIASVLALGAAARADNVTFSVVSGTFAGADGQTLSGAGTNSITYQKNNASLTQVHLTFTAAAGAIDLSPMSGGDVKPVSSFGTFTISVPQGTETLQIDDNFTLTLNVTAPFAGSGSNSVPATPVIVSGKIQSGAGNAGHSMTIDIPSFSIPALGLPKLTFAFNDITDLAATASQSTRTLSGTVTYDKDSSTSPAVDVVPTPAAATSGLMLLGVLGALKLRRKS